MSELAEADQRSEQGLPSFDARAEEAVAEILASALRREAPWAHYRALRDRAPVYFSRRRGMWFITNYRGVEAILKSPVALLDFQRRMDTVRPDWRDHPSSANVAPFIAFVDGEAHRKIRAPLSPSWTPKEMERFRPSIRQIAEGVVDRYVAGGGGSFADLVAFPFAQSSLYHLFAFDASKLPNARDMVHRMQIGFEIDVTPEQLADADAASTEYRNFWQEEFAARALGPPGDDMLSQLLCDESFTVEDVALIAESLFSGGFDTTALTMTTGMWLLASNPEEMERARSNPEAMDRLSEEIIRMGSSIPMTIRVAMDAIDVEGFTIRKNDVVAIVLGAANRDPAMYPDPDKFSLSRAPFRTLAFSYGAHACLGQWLARIEIKEMFRALLERTSRLKQIGDPIFRDRQSVRGVEDVFLEVEPR
jgi:unspecific monooxygenase